LRIVTPADFIKEIKSSRRRPLYLLCGAEFSAVTRCLTAAEEAVAEGLCDFNFQALDLEAGMAGYLVGEALTRPFFTPPRILVAKKPAFTANDWNILAAYLDNPNKDSSVIIILEQIDVRFNFFKKVRANGLEVNCQAPKGVFLVRWLVSEFRKRGYIISPALSELVIERVGGDFNLLLNEVEKLSLYLGEGGTLTSELICTLISLTPEANIFELVNALSCRDLKKTLANLWKLLDVEAPPYILAMMGRQFRLILKIKTRQAATGQKYLKAEDARLFKLSPYRLKIFQEQTSVWAWLDIFTALTALEDAYHALFTTSVPPQLILEDLVLKLIRPAHV